MNKVSSKNKGCANQKCSQQQSGAHIKKSDNTEALKKNVRELKAKAKAVNGLVNGVTDDEQIISNKTDNQSSQKTEEDIAILRLELKQPETSNGHDGNKTTADEVRPPKKSKSKKRNKSDQPEARCDVVEEPNCSEFDIASFIRNRYKDDGADSSKSDLVSSLDNLDINKGERPEEPEEVPRVENPVIEYVAYQSELQMPLIMKIIQKDLSEPYSIYTYRYFIHNWPNLCFLAMCEEVCVGAIVCKLDIHRNVIKRGYIAMLAVDKRYRKHGIGSTLVRRAIQEMIAGDADEVVLETEITNKPALRLYEALGFVRDKRLFRYYLNGVDALRLKLWLR